MLAANQSIKTNIIHIVNVMVKLFVFIFCFGTGTVMGLSCEQQYTNIFDTSCAKIYDGLRRSATHNGKIDLFNEWRKYERQCSETGEYQIYLADRLQAMGRDEEAQSILRKIILEKGQQHDVRAAYGVLLQSLLSENKLNEAKEVAMQCMIHYPYWYRGYLDYGKVLVFQNKFEEGKTYIDKSISWCFNYYLSFAL